MTKAELYNFNLLPYKNLLYAMKSNKKTIAFVHGTHMGKTIIVMKALANVGRKNKILFITNKNAHETIESNNIYGLDIKYCTYNYFSSNERVVEAYLNYNTFIVDEMHHLGSDVYGENIQKLLKMIEEDLTDSKIGIGMTATPRRSDGINVCQYFQTYVQGITLYDAIQLSIVKNPNYVMCGKDVVFNRFMEDLTIQELNDMEVDWNDEENIKLLKRGIEANKSVSRWIVITNTIEECNKIHDIIEDAFPDEYRIETITSEGQTCELRDFLDNKDKVVFISCLKLIESVHLPLIGGIINVRHIVTKSLFEQIMGRTTCPYSKKAPVFLDFAYIYLRMRSIMNNNLCKNGLYDDEPDIVELINGTAPVHPYRIDIIRGKDGETKFTVVQSDETADIVPLKPAKDTNHHSRKNKDIMNAMNITAVSPTKTSKLSMKKVADIIRFLYTPRYGNYFTLKELWKSESKLFTIKVAFDVFVRMIKKYDDDWKTVLDICKNKGVVQYKNKMTTIKDVYNQYITEHNISNGLDFGKFQSIFIQQNFNIKKTMKYISLGKVINSTYFFDIKSVYNKYKNSFIPKGNSQISFDVFNVKLMNIRSVEETIKYFQEGKYA